MITVLGAAILATAGLALWNVYRTPRIAYIRSQELVYGYFGMKEAMNEFQVAQTGWRSNVDTLRADLERGIAAMKATAENTAERTERQNMLRTQQDDLLRYNDAMSKKLQEQEKALLQGVLGQVNTFVENYAEEHGYDVVLGTTEGGSLLYGKGAMDITDEVLAALNHEHEGIAR